MAIRRGATIAALLLLAAIPPLLGPDATANGGWAPEQGAVALAVTAAVPFDPAPFAGRCGDEAGVWTNMRWSSRLRWQINTDSIPRYLDDRPGVVASMRAAAGAVAAGSNDCGRPADLAIDQRYTGTTNRHANVTSTGSCGHRDGHNVVSFGHLTPGLLAVTCVFWEDHGSQGRSVEADVLVDSTADSFFLTLPPDCRGRWDLEGILTHEFGHVFGLGHVSYPRHGTQTMSDRLPECNTTYRGLGLGDYLVLHAHYARA